MAQYNGQMRVLVDRHDESVVRGAWCVARLIVKFINLSRHAPRLTQHTSSSRDDRGGVGGMEEKLAEPAADEAFLQGAPLERPVHQEIPFDLDHASP